MTKMLGKSIGRYHIVEKLGEGGMASVYKSFDTRLERNVALKVIRAGQVDTPGFLQRFEREAKALAQMSHPNIVKILDFGDYEDQLYLVMEYLPGGTLKEKMGIQVPYQEAARLLIPVAKALGYAHSRKIIHRDIKPANILLTESGQPMLSDFGIAKILGSDEGVDLTGTGVGIGTPEYMAPEQAMGKDIDHRVDIYALGVVLYELLTGRKPFEADTPIAVVLKHISEPLPRPREFTNTIPEFAEQVIFKSLAKNPVDRFQDMESFVEALEKFLQIPIAKTRVEQPSAAFQQGTQTKPYLSDSFDLPGRTVPSETPSRADPRSVYPPIPVKKGSSIPIILILGIALAGMIIVGGIIAVVAGSLLFGKETPTAISAELGLMTETPWQVISDNVQPTDITLPAIPSLPTATELPTQSPPPPASDQEILYVDDFSYPNSGWEIGDYENGSVGYKDGVYFVISSVENMNMYGASFGYFTDVVIEVDTIQFHGPANNNNDFGVMCRVQSGGDGYSFNISGDGFYSIQKAVNDEFTDLIEWTSSDVIRQGSSINHLKVICDGSKFVLFVNDTRLVETSDTSFSSGDIAFSATTFESEYTEVHFDNIVVSSP
ncbi:MAG: protein kinase [Anaerolineaceae bacterium]|nr:protein kinase [Anaerolineaceae bacterium]